MTMWMRWAACAWLAWAGTASAAPVGIEATVRAQSLELEFEQAMAVLDNAPVREVTTTPAVPMTCAWSDDHHLACVPDGGHAFPRATRFAIRIAPGLRRADGTPLGAARLAVESDRPVLTAWIPAWSQGRPQLRVDANLPMTADAIARVLELRAGDRVWRSLAVTPSPTPALPWAQPGFGVALPSDLPPGVVSLHLREGLRSTAGPLTSTSARTLLSFRNAEPFALRRAACRTHTPADVRAEDSTDGFTLDCVPGEVLELSFSAPMDAAGQDAFAAMLPSAVRVLGWDERMSAALQPDAPLTAPGAHVRLRAVAPNTQIAFTVGTTLRDAAGRKLVRPAPILVRNGAPLPVLAAAGPRTLFGAPDRALVASINAPGVEIAETRLGRAGADAQFRLPATRGSAGAYASEGARATLAEHGWVRWRPQGQGNASLDFAAPAFDLSAQVSPTAVLAWAVDWRDSRPVAGARVELAMVAADGTTRVVARDRIGSDGLARLSLPADFTLPKTEAGAVPSTWVLRATAGQGLAVLPLGDVGEGRAVLGRLRPALRLFAVTDRPLYRAGDTVRFRAWLRERRGGRLVAPDATSPVELQLLPRYGEQPIARTTVSLDAEGATVGAFVLPSQTVDGDYCLSVADARGADAPICVFVGTFRAQDLWIDAQVDTPLLREGDPLRLRVGAGYWSGGPAAGVAMSRIDLLATRASPADAYPLFAGYAFAGDADAGLEPDLRDDTQAWPALDAQGKADVAVPVAFKADPKRTPPAFARVEASAQIGLTGREPVTSVPAVAWLARFERYVGLKLDPDWFDAATPLRFDAVVIDAAGHARDGAPVEVAVDYLPEDHAAPVRVATCALAAGIPAPCDVPRTRSGRYRFTARSGDAAPTTIERDVWNAADRRVPASTPTTLTVVEAPKTADAPMRLRLQQPYPQADAWVVVSADGEALDSRIVPLDRPDTILVLPTHADGRNRVDVDVRVRQRRAAGVNAVGLRDVPGVLDRTVGVDVPRPSPVATLALDAPATRTTPGAPVHLRLRNTGTTPRTVVLAVFDDALRALAGDRWNVFDPQGDGWLGARDGDWYARFKATGFDDWCRCGWRRVLPWPDDKPAPDATGEATSPVLSIDRAAIEGTGLTAVGDVLFDITGRDGGALRGAPAAARRQDGFDAGFGYVGGADSSELDSVVVTGSRIRHPAEEANAFARTQPVLSIDRATPMGAAPSADARALFGGRLRETFAETALWQPSIVLAPGETREVALVAPDNLTRWRAVAWTADAGEAFERVEATFEVGQPVEVRLQAPVRVYPDDRAVLVANVRHEGEAATADAVLRVDALDAMNERQVPLAANGQDALSLAIAPTDRDGVPGTLEAVAAARTAAGADATSQGIELASPLIETHRTQASWLGASPLRLPPPTLPAGATDLRMQVSLLPTGDALAHGWIDALERYPHRCWEQMLSRAVAAAIALERGEGERFPAAQATIDDALRNAPVFQNEDGSFRYFADARDTGENAARVPLTAWSVRALRLLRTLGHAVPADALEHAETFLGDAIDDIDDDAHGDDADTVVDHTMRLALAAAAQDAPSRALGDRLWRAFAQLPLPAQVATVHALAAMDHPQTRAAVDAVLARAQRRDDALRLRESARYDRWMSSALREQCELVGVLREHPALADAATRRRLIAGLADLYAGGTDAIDTQAAANCLIALRGLEAASAAAHARLDVEVGTQRVTLELAPGQSSPTWQPSSADAHDARRPLVLTPHVDGEAPASVVVDYAWREDARQAASSAVGFALQRRYEALRGGRWVPLADANLRDGDWVRVTLVLDNAATRYFVAITDAVPGALRPSDLSLSGVAGVDVQRVADEGDGWFATRRLDPRAPKFYAEFLPPGRHEVHYFARVGNAGDYLAPSAVAELMYGATTRARTAATRVRAAPATDAR